MTLRHFALLMLINVIWGFNLVAAKVGVTELPPLLFAALRFVVLFAILLPFLRPFPGRMWPIFWIAMTTGGLHFSLLYIGLRLADDASTVAIAIQLNVPFATLLSAFFLGEQVGWRRWSGILVAFFGVLLIGFDPQVFSYLDGLLLTVSAALSGATGILLMKRLSGIGVFQLQAWVATLSWPLLLGLSLLTEPGQMAAVAQAGPLAWATVLYTSIFASLIGHGGLFWLLQRYDISIVSPLTLVSTVFGVFFAVTLLGDRLTERMLVGAVLTLGGVFIIAMRSRRAPTRTVAAGAEVAPVPRNPDT
ncbi:MAG: DMT family transporter [Gammaproteobacteria bacterium]